MNAPMTLAPTTGILLTAIQSGMSHIDAAAEFVDNSFGPAAGNADKIWIIDAKDAVIFLDQGNGVSDINLLFRLGDGQSRNSGNDIGRFGVGSKFGALAFGTNVEVKTVRDDVYHEFSVDWQDVLETGKWPKGYVGKGKSKRNAPKAIRNGGTMIIVRGIHKNRTRPIKATYIKELGLRFQVSLLDGKDIIYCRATSLSAFLKGKIKEDVSIANAFEQHLDSSLIDRSDDNLSFDGNGFDSEIMFGKLRTGDKKLSGVHIAYGGRTVEITNKLTGTGGEDIQVPGRFFARVILGPAWKDCLNYNKTSIVVDRDRLLLAIYESAKDLIAKMANDESSEVLEKLATQLTNMISPELGQKLTLSSNGSMMPSDDEGDDAPGLGKTDNPVNPDEPNDHVPEHGEPEKGSKAGETHDGHGGLFRLSLEQVNDGEHGRSAYASLERHGKLVVGKVCINVDKELMKNTLLNSPANRPATMLVCLNALADYMVKNPVWIGDMFDEDQANDLLTSDQIEQHSAIYDELVNTVRTEV